MLRSTPIICLKLTDAKVVHAESKTARNNKQGVIIMKFENFDHKQSVLKSKKSLEKIKKYEKKKKICT